MGALHLLGLNVLLLVADYFEPVDVTSLYLLVLNLHLLQFPSNWGALSLEAQDLLLL